MGLRRRKASTDFVFPVSRIGLLITLVFYHFYDVLDDKWKVDSGFWVRIERMVEDSWVQRRGWACFTPLARIALEQSALAMLNEHQHFVANG